MFQHAVSRLRGPRGRDRYFWASRARVVKPIPTRLPIHVHKPLGARDVCTIASTGVAIADCSVRGVNRNSSYDTGEKEP
jgi:hypothetical protein